MHSPFRKKQRLLCSNTQCMTHSYSAELLEYLCKCCCTVQTAERTAKSRQRFPHMINWLWLVDYIIRRGRGLDTLASSRGLVQPSPLGRRRASVEQLERAAAFTERSKGCTAYSPLGRLPKARAPSEALQTRAGGGGGERTATGPMPLTPPPASWRTRGRAPRWRSSRRSPPLVSMRDRLNGTLETPLEQVPDS